jgi:hypothetical protein
MQMKRNAPTTSGAADFGSELTLTNWELISKLLETAVAPARVGDGVVVDVPVVPVGDVKEPAPVLVEVDAMLRLLVDATVIVDAAVGIVTTEASAVGSGSMRQPPSAATIRKVEQIFGDGSNETPPGFRLVDGQGGCTALPYSPS